MGRGNQPPPFLPRGQPALASLAARFLHLFAGLERSHGLYTVPPGAATTEKGKLHDTKWARTVHEPLTEAKWEAHLEGKIGLGIVPIRDDSTARFGAIDVDVYPIDLPALAARINELGLPLTVCRTKSGGAHLYLFLSEPTPAPLVRAKLREFSNTLGLKPDTEIFPKQDRLTPDSDGSWINMPFQSGARSTRYALGPDGVSLTPEAFLDYAQQQAVTTEELEAFEVAVEDNSSSEDSRDFEGGPPCLQTLSQRGFGDWQNQGLFNVAVFLRKKYGDAWVPYLSEYNQRYMDPPVPSHGLLGIIKSVGKKTYSYTCKQEPICSVCDKKTCKTRDFGVGGQPIDNGINIGELVKLETEPPSYTVEIEGNKIKCDADDLLDQRKFRKLVFLRLNIIVPVIKPFVWDALLNDRLSRININTVPDDATHEGQFWIHVQKFCTDSNRRGREWDELIRGKPYTENGMTHFCSIDLFNYLHQQRFNSVTEKDVFGWMHKRGVINNTRDLKGKPTKYWSIPAFAEQTEEFTIPRAPLPERM